MKRIVSVILCFAICMSLVLGALAEEFSGKELKTNSSIESVSGLNRGLNSKNGFNANKLNLVQGALAKYTLVNEASILKTYSDIKTSPYKTYLAKLNFLGVMGGYSKNSMKPQQTVTIGEFIVWIIRALGDKPAFGKTYGPEPYVSYAKKYGIIDETEYKDFEKPILKMQACKMLVKAMMLWDNTKLDPRDGKIYYEDPFKETVGIVDGEANVHQIFYISDEMKDYTSKALAYGLVGFNEKTGKFEPTTQITKGMASKYILKMLDKKARTPFDLATGYVVKVPTRSKQSMDLDIQDKEFVKKFLAGGDYATCVVALPYNKDLLNLTKTLIKPSNTSGNIARLSAIYESRGSSGLQLRFCVTENVKSYAIGSGEFITDIYLNTVIKDITISCFDVTQGAKFYEEYKPMFEYLFGKDSVKGLAELKKLLKGRGEAPGGYKNKFTLNGRVNDIFQSGDSTFSWRISIK